jgi:hypothetical protein
LSHPRFLGPRKGTKKRGQVHFPEAFGKKEKKEKKRGQKKGSGTFIPIGADVYRVGEGSASSQSTTKVASAIRWSAKLWSEGRLAAVEKKGSGTFSRSLWPPTRSDDQFTLGQSFDLEPEPLTTPGLLLAGRQAQGLRVAGVQAGVEQVPVRRQAFGIGRAQRGIGRVGRDAGVVQAVGIAAVARPAMVDGPIDHAGTDRVESAARVEKCT